MNSRQDDSGSILGAVHAHWAHNESDIPLLERSTTRPLSPSQLARKSLPAQSSGKVSWVEGISFHSGSSPTHAYTQVSGVPTDIKTPNSAVLAGPILDTQTGHIDSEHAWLPFSLRRLYISLVLLLTLALFAAVLSLLIFSLQNSGLGEDNGSSILFFGWRFAPTLFAVVYALLCTILLKDVKRTEPYARLAVANVRGADPRWTIWQEPGAWWTALRGGFSRKRNNGSWSWSLISSALCMVISSFVLLPLSSTLLLSVDTALARPFLYNQFDMGQSNLVFDLNDQSIQRSRTISNVLQNVTTSAWISDNYTVLPIWPSGLVSPLLGATLTNQTETWHVESYVLSTEMSCQPLHLVSNDWVNMTIHPDTNQTTTFGSVHVATDDGCGFTLLLQQDFDTMVTNGGASWAPKGTFFFALGSESQQYGTNVDTTNSTDPRYQLDDASSCSADEILFLTSQWVQVINADAGVEHLDGWNSSFQIAGQACSTSYFISKTNVAIENDAGISTMTFDQADYQRNKQNLNAGLLDTSIFQTLFLTPKWTDHLIRPETGFNQWPLSGGPASLLMAHYNFSTSDAINDPNLMPNANRIRQRYIGEAMISALSNSGTKQSANQQGSITSIQSRIVVSKPVAITIEALLVVDFCLILILFVSSRLSSRPLNVTSDPAKAALIAKFIANPSLRQDFAKESHVNSKQMKQHLNGKRYWTSINTLYAHGEVQTFRADSRDDKLEQDTKLKWRAGVLHRWTIFALVVLLLLVAGLIAALYVVSRGPGLYGRAFFYEARVVILDNLSIVAPYSIIPTLIAVGISLWWGSIEGEFRSLQPYIAMVREPVSFNDGMFLSYQSSYHVYAVAKAGMRRHWLLALICLGGVLLQVFTIAMSSLWKPVFQQKITLVNLQRQLEVRATPLITESQVAGGSGSGDTASSIVLSDLYGNLRTNWLYSAMIQLTLNGSQPSWSRDGWSFVPVDLSSIPNSRSIDESDSITQWKKVSVTLVTPALRGRLECNPYGGVADLSRELFLQDFTNSTLWNVTNNPTFPTTGYQLSRSLNTTVLRDNADTTLDSSVINTNISTSFFANPALLNCCENKTTGDTGDAAIGYWSQQYDGAPDVLSTFQKTRTSNFTVKWLHGQPVAGFQKTNETIGSYIVWPDLPRMAALDCSPVIEKTNARVTVDQKTGNVISYVLLEDPQTDATAWTDPLILHEPYNGVTSTDFAGNVTSSYGPLFVRALLKSADIGFLAGVGSAFIDDWGSEPINDVTFTFRRPGINMDYMSYSMYAQAGYDSQIFLDETKLYEFANRTFSAFFQHYVSSNNGPATLQTGNWAFQKIGEKLPSDLTPVLNPENIIVPPGVTLSDSPDQHTDRNVQVSVSTPVKILRMSPTAAWLCVGILAWLAATAVWIIVIEKRYLGKMQGGVGKIADVAALVAGSDALMSHIQNEGINGASAANLKTKLGWFRDRNGRDRWGIELVGIEHGVQWLDEDQSIKR